MTVIGMADATIAIDLDRYRLDDPELIRAGRAGLRANGIACLPGFIRPAAVEAMCREAELLEPSGHHSTASGSPYLAPPDASYASGHPRRRVVHNSLLAIAYDLLAPTSLLRSVYEWDPLLHFVRELLGLDELYRYGDPFGACNIAAMRDGDELGWHFDMVDFVVSIALQSSKAGGAFESACRVRSQHDEQYDRVGAVLDGSTAGVTTVAMEPGTLLLFEGRHSLHRVTPILGETARYVALLAYDTHHGTDSSDRLKSVRYGRVR